MNPWRPYGLLIALAGFAVGCVGSSASDTGYWDVDPNDPLLDGVPFEPDVLMVYAYASYDGDILDEFMLEPGNAASTLPPVMMFLFADHRYFSTWNQDYACEWVGQVTVEGVDDMGSPELWLGYAVSLKLLETDCYDMDPWVWGETTPSSVMESAFLGLGYGPLSSGFETELRALAEVQGQDWDRDWAPYTFSMHVGLWDDDQGGLVPHEVAFAQSYEMVDGALSSALNDNPVLLPLTGDPEPPEGLIIGFSWRELEPSVLF